MSYQGHSDQRWGCTTYAQHADDLMLLNLCELLDIKPGGWTWLEAGSHHPVTISNTKLLYDRGFRGVNVDANDRLMKRFEADRPEDKNLCVGVGPEAGVKSFLMFDETSGLNTFSETEAANLAGRMPEPKRRDIAVLTLNQLVDGHLGDVWPPLLLLDIEGLDLDLLEATRFAPGNMPKVVVAEVRKAETSRAIDILAWRGYVAYCRMGENVFFLRCDCQQAALGV